MGIFIETLKQMASSGLPPIGFKRNILSTNKRLLVAVETTRTNLKSLANLSPPPEALIMQPEELIESTDTFEEVIRNTKLPLGIRLQSSKDVNILSSLAINEDFLIVSPYSPLNNRMGSREVSRILEINGEIEASLLRAADEAPIDAFWLNRKGLPASELTWLDLITTRRISNLVTRPILIAAPISVQDEELLALWSAGVDSIVVSATDADDIGNVAGLISRIHAIKLPLRPPKIKGKIVTPYPAGIIPAEKEDEDEGEDDSLLYTT